MIVKDILRNIKPLRRYKCYLTYSRQYGKYLRQLGLPNKKKSGEDEYVAKWSQLYKRVDRNQYRLFSHYCGNDADIVPEDIGRMIIEPKLNPIHFQQYYSDKNIFPVLLGKDALPSTILCRINGSCLLDGDFHPLTQEIEEVIGKREKVLLKPSVDSDSGHGVFLFKKEKDNYKSVSSSDILSYDFLLQYGKDFVLQECVEQHEYISQFCSSSVNTIRLGVYRSVRNEEPIVLSAIMRIGKEGSHVDNAHAGGMFIGIDSSDGTLSKYVCDQYGNKASIWNDINFEENNFKIPCWDQIIELAKTVSHKIIHCRLLALDIALTKEGKPILIEYNINGFSYWLFMYTGHKALGNVTDEIIDYCKDTADNCHFSCE